MTMPHLMNCSHSPDSWCLDCVRREHDELTDRAERAEDEATMLAGRIADLERRLAEAEEIVATMERLRADGWCVVIKVLPPQIGYLIEGSRSEYDEPCEDQRIGEGKWCCEAQDMAYIENGGRYRHSQFSLADTAEEALRNVANEIAAEAKGGE